MNNKKGFTLIEVILSLAILGIISVSFLTAISSHFTFLNKSIEISEKAFSAQGEMEKEINIIKEKIRNDTLKKTDLKQKTIFPQLGGIKVYYQPVSKKSYNKTYYTFVSDVKPIIFEPLEMKSIGVDLKQVEASVPNIYGLGEFKVIGNFENQLKDKNNKDVRYEHLLNVVEWYSTTKKEYNMPFPKKTNFIIEDDYKNYYPEFPMNYVLISNDTTDLIGKNPDIRLPKIEEYMGNHIIFSATPGSKSGKIGIPKITNPVFISGLPVIDNISIHLDASYIDRSMPEEVDIKKNPINVNQWIDISSVIGKTKPNEKAVPVESSKKPSLMKTNLEVKYVGQFVRFADQDLTITKAGAEGKRFKYFAVVRSTNSSDKEAIFLKNGIIAPIKIKSESKILDEDWVIEMGELVANDNIFKIGGTNVDIAEIAIYKQDGLTEEQTELIKKYFLGKYDKEYNQ